MSRRRSLSDDEQALWDGFTRSIAPMRRQAKPAKPSIKTNPQPTSTPAVAAAAVPSSPRPHVPPRQAPPLAPLGRRLKQRVARGREPIDVRIDLHGMTQREAHAALLHFLHRAQADGARTALIVTGKGSGKASDDRDAMSERGVLKRQVPLWLALPEFRPLVVGFDEAHVGHGGKGALYVRLRRGK
jgi:DNA-nicking Smr family endonuclease